MEILAETPMRFENSYAMEPPAEGERMIPWRADNPAIGALAGTFVIAGDTIMSLFGSEDRQFAGSEHLILIDAHRYQSRGMFTNVGRVISAWAVELRRES